MRSTHCSFNAIMFPMRAPVRYGIPVVFGVLTQLISAPLLAAPRAVACVGDSITEGAGSSSSAQNYPSQLGNRLGSAFDVKNFGVSGMTMLRMTGSAYTNTDAYNNSTMFTNTADSDVVLQFGANDSKPENWSADNKNRFLGDCLALVQHYRDAGSRRVWINLPPPAGTGGVSACCSIRRDVIENEILPLLRTCAAQKNASAIDVFSAMKGHKEWFADGVHPNDQGYAALADVVAMALKRIPAAVMTVPRERSANASLAITIEATAAYGNVGKIELLAGTDVIGSATTSPATIDWQPPANGSYMLSARITDSGGLVGMIPPETVTIADSAVGQGGSITSPGVMSNVGGAGGPGGGGSRPISTPTTGAPAAASTPPADNGGGYTGSCQVALGLGKSTVPASAAFAGGGLLFLAFRREKAVLHQVFGLKKRAKLTC